MAGRKLGTQVGVMLGDEEHAYLLTESSEMGLSLSAYFRMLLKADMRKQGK